MSKAAATAISIDCGDLFDPWELEETTQRIQKSYGRANIHSR
jgi:hypothetical protein